MGIPNLYYSRVIEDIDVFRNGRGIVYCPMYAGALKIGLPLESLFHQKKIIYRRLPVYFERKKSVIERPTRREVEEARQQIRRATQQEPAYFILDDITSEGRGALTFYDWLLNIGARREDIAISAALDNTRITGRMNLIFYAQEEIAKILEMDPEAAHSRLRDLLADFKEAAYGGHDASLQLKLLKTQATIPEKTEIVHGQGPHMAHQRLIIVEEGSRQRKTVVTRVRDFLEGGDIAKDVREIIKEKLGDYD